MGLLDRVIGDVVGNVVGQVLGGGRGGAALSPIVKALLMLLISKGVSGGLGGGLGDILGGGHGSRPDRPEPGPFGHGHGPDAGEGDLGGFGGPSGGGPLPQDGEYGDLAGMLDGPGDRDGDRSGGPAPGPDREPEPAGGDPVGGGLGGLIESFERSGLGDVIGSWIGGGRNRAIAPDRLAEALGPDTVATLSRETGLDRAALLDQLAQALPAVVDALTPQGRVPPGHG